MARDKARGLHQPGHPRGEDDLGALALETAADGPCGLAGLDEERHEEAVADREVVRTKPGADGRDLHAGSGEVDAQRLQEVDLGGLGRSVGLGAGQPAVATARSR
jgi:hypothetical protein